MTPVEIVAKAIDSLNKNKNAGMHIHSIRSDGRGGVDIRVTYKKPIKDWDDDGTERYYGFSGDWFKSEKIDLEDYPWMDGFRVPDILRIKKPEDVCILRIAYYFWKRGVDEGVL